ncbi:adenosylmethionine decarboxylase [Tissierella sp. MB52-C2]|uniref:adenosylmethionine decarboxylase n=1 Tax=Tissierella sp. MB52-C2 TaxID=3070999 RepID=UPI00280AD5A9|nr:adenosylmethionine decarboxylase [Tissierella sp. MB52-C2]WMM25253.1 adenosylmethionine decarboxylase [Tissierella sp. MB52-C2]
MIKQKQLGNHLLIEYYDCDSEVLKNTQLIEKYMIEAAKMAHATIVESVFHTFSPWGVSGVVVIEESHLTIHTWPEYKYAAVDLFTCGNTIKPWVAFKFLEEKLKAERADLAEISRGMIGRILKDNKNLL